MKITDFNEEQQKAIIDACLDINMSDDVYWLSKDDDGDVGVHNDEPYYENGCYFSNGDSCYINIPFPKFENVIEFKLKLKAELEHGK